MNNEETKIDWIAQRTDANYDCAGYEVEIEDVTPDAAEVVADPPEVVADPPEVGADPPA